MDSTYCKKCDSYYDWAAPECPSCYQSDQWQKRYDALLAKFYMATKLIAVLPKCDRVKCGVLATRYEEFDERDNGIEFKTRAWRCDEHKLSNGIEIDELDYAKELRDLLKILKGY